MKLGKAKQLIPIVESLIVERMTETLSIERLKYEDIEIKNVFVKIQSSTSGIFCRIGFLCITTLHLLDQNIDLLDYLLGEPNLMQRQLLKMAGGKDKIKEDLNASINANIKPDEFVVIYLKEGNDFNISLNKTNHNYLGIPLKSFTFVELFS